MKHYLYLEQNNLKIINKKQETINKTIHCQQIYTFEFWIKFN